jgi:fructuronate reductase
MDPTATPDRLCSETLHRLPASVRVPAYDRTRVRARVLHIGAGAFHRCHQAEYADDLLAAGETDCAIQALNLRPPDLAPLIGVQDGLYCRELRSGDQVDRRVIGSILGARTVPDPADPAHDVALEEALTLAADVAIEVISCTVTEKGYCHVPATGELDLGHPDVAHDLDDPHRPTSLPGFLVEVLRRRLAAGVELPVMLSCDNVPGNGSTLRRVVLALAERSAPELADRLAREAVFPNTMVDRIVPATRDENVEAFTALTGLHDAGLVSGEPFRMWVVGDLARDRLPTWDRVGVIFTDRVEDYETLKMRVVNGIQSNLCQLGFLGGFEFMADVMADPLMAAFARRGVEREVVPWLVEVPGVDIPAYVEETLGRVANPALQHRCAQISTDGSRKVRQRLIEPILDAHAAGQPTPCLLLGLAGWTQYVSGRSLDGSTHPVDDPLAAEVAAITRVTGADARAYVAGVVGLRSVFPVRFAEDPVLVDGLVDSLIALRERGVRDAVGAVLAR